LPTLLSLLVFSVLVKLSPALFLSAAHFFVDPRVSPQRVPDILFASSHRGGT
jgi:hypothetical protein